MIRAPLTRAALVVTLMLAVVPVPPVAAQDLPPTVMSPGPLDKSYGTWGALWASWWSAASADQGCSEGNVGSVFLVPPGFPKEVLRCEVPAGVPLLIGMTGRECVTNARAERRVRNATDEDERRGFQRAWGRDLAKVHLCLSRTLGALKDPYLTIDGRPVPVGEDFVTMGEIAVPSGRRWVIGFFAMLEPLPVGSHSVEWGLRPSPESGTRPELWRRSAVLEVVEPSAP
jgi:hypothetical protein